jgi:hypothetical protein
MDVDDRSGTLSLSSAGIDKENWTDGISDENVPQMITEGYDYPLQ